MKKRFIFFRASGTDIDAAMRIEVGDREIRDKIVTNYRIIFEEKPLKKMSSLKEDFVLDVGVLLVSKPQTSARSGRRTGFFYKGEFYKREIKQHLSFYYSDNKNTPIFLFSTPMGSRIKIDYSMGYASVNIIKGDNLEEHLILKINLLTLLSTKILRVHGVSIRRGNSSLLFIGESGAGKTTLAGLFLKENKKSEVIEDDSTCIFPTGNSVYAFSLGKNSSYPVSQLFFIERRINKLSEIYSINHKEAFKRIIFYSDIILKKNDPLIEYRLKTLDKLVHKCKCYVFVNGKDLKDNLKRLKRLILIDKVI